MSADTSCLLPPDIGTMCRNEYVALNEADQKLDPHRHRFYRLNKHCNVGISPLHHVWLLFNKVKQPLTSASKMKWSQMWCCESANQSRAPLLSQAVIISLVTASLSSASSFLSMNLLSPVFPLTSRLSLTPPPHILWVYPLKSFAALFLRDFLPTLKVSQELFVFFIKSGVLGRLFPCNLKGCLRCSSLFEGPSINIFQLHACDQIEQILKSDFSPPPSQVAVSLWANEDGLLSEQLLGKSLKTSKSMQRLEITARYTCQRWLHWSGFYTSSFQLFIYYSWITTRSHCLSFIFQVKQPRLWLPADCQVLTGNARCLSPPSSRFEHNRNQFSLQLTASFLPLKETSLFL